MGQKWSGTPVNNDGIHWFITSAPLYIYIYIYIEREREKEKQTDRDWQGLSAVRVLKKKTKKILDEKDCQWNK